VTCEAARDVRVGRRAGPQHAGTGGKTWIHKRLRHIMQFSLDSDAWSTSRIVRPLAGTGGRTHETRQPLLR